MKKTILAYTAATVGALLLSAPFFVMAEDVNVGVSVSANVGSTTKAEVRAQTRAALMSSILTKAQDRGDQEISRRLDSLAKLSDRISNMSRVSASEQTALQSTIQTQVDALNSLKTKIDADDSTTSLRTDIKSIADSYRIYLLIMPQTAILAAVDRIGTIVTNMQTIGGKLSARISAAQSSGDVSAAQALLTDYNAKLNDASSASAAAQAEVSGLQPDNGDKTVAQSNLSALKDARSKIKKAQQDLVAARKDISSILQALPKASGSVSASSSASVSQ